MSAPTRAKWKYAVDAKEFHAEHDYARYTMAFNGLLAAQAILIADKEVCLYVSPLFPTNVGRPPSRFRTRLQPAITLLDPQRKRTPNCVTAPWRLC